MFTGLIEGRGRVRCLRRHLATAQLELETSLGSLKKGESIAVNGCCLTVIQKGKKSFTADLSAETLRVTNLGRLRPGDHVNLERPIRLSDRLGGHLVQGHVDGVGEVVRINRNSGRKSGRNDVGRGLEVKIQIPTALRRYLIPKGSIAVDGVSMTVNRLTPHHFTLVIIPQTLQMTNMAHWRVGDRVNLEVDIIGKYIESFTR